jgi:hypothetical protein
MSDILAIVLIKRAATRLCSTRSPVTATPSRVTVLLEGERLDWGSDESARGARGSVSARAIERSGRDRRRRSSSGLAQSSAGASTGSARPALRGWRFDRDHRPAAGRLKRTRVPAAASASQIRPPWASTIARETARPRPAPTARPRGPGAAAVERLEHVLALLGAIPSPVSATSISIRSATGSARTTTLPSAGVWRIAFWIRLNRTRWSFSGWRAGGPTSRDLGKHGHSLGLRLHAHRLDRLLDQLLQRHALQRPADVARLQPRELEQIVDQALSASMWVRMRSQVGAPGLAVDDVVLHRVGEQPQRGDRRAQVVRDGRDEAAAGCLGLIARRLLVRRRSIIALAARASSPSSSSTWC